MDVTVNANINSTLKTRKDNMNTIDAYKKLDETVDMKKVLGSMYSMPPDISIENHMRFITSNLGNPGLYPGTLKMEKDVMEFIYDLVGRTDCISGRIVSGGTEANITALWIMRNIEKSRNSGRKKILIPPTAHFSIIKAIDLLELEPVIVPVDKQYKIIPEEIADLSENAMGIVAIAGNTEFGTVDPIDKISNIVNIPVHVDAAFGGFVLPFMEDKKSFGFENEMVRSITIDPHKMGLSTIPAGALVLRNADMWNYIRFPSVYLTERENTSLLGTRGSGGVAGAFSSINHFGREGYRKIVDNCMLVTKYLAKEIRKIGHFIPVEPETNILTFDMPEDTYYKMERKGWHLSRTKNGNYCRLVIMPHVTMEVAENFVDDLNEITS